MRVLDCIDFYEIFCNYCKGHFFCPTLYLLVSKSEIKHTPKLSIDAANVPEGSKSSPQMALSILQICDQKTKFSNS